MIEFWSLEPDFPLVHVGGGPSRRLSWVVVGSSKATGGKGGEVLEDRRGGHGWTRKATRNSMRPPEAVREPSESTNELLGRPLGTIEEAAGDRRGGCECPSGRPRRPLVVIRETTMAVRIPVEEAAGSHQRRRSRPRGDVGRPRVGHRVDGGGGRDYVEAVARCRQLT